MGGENGVFSCCTPHKYISKSIAGGRVTIVTSESVDQLACFRYDNGGEYSALVGRDVVRVYHLNTWQFDIEMPNVKDVVFSPRSKYISVCGDCDKNAEPNGRMYDLATRRVLLEYGHNTRLPPGRRWSSDEKYFVACTKKCKICVYTMENCEQSTEYAMDGHCKFLSLPAENAKGSGSIAGLFCKSLSEKNKDAWIGVRKLGTADKTDIMYLDRPGSVDFHWSSTGEHLLLVCHETMSKDKTSYYGPTSLHFYSCGRGAFERLHLPTEGPIHDVAWSPTSETYAVIYGFVPSRITVFNAKQEILYDIPSGFKNVLKFNRQGTLLCIAGLGNLHGCVEVWSLKTENDEARQISSFEYPCASGFEWDNTGKYLLFSVVFRKLRVDNGIKIFRYTGELVHQEKYEILSDAGWVPNRKTLPAFDIEFPASGVVTQKKAIYVPRIVDATGKCGEAGASMSSMDKARLKAIEKLKKRLELIKKLKESQQAGRVLTPQQVAAVSTESDLFARLGNLSR